MEKDNFYTFGPVIFVLISLATSFAMGVVVGNKIGYQSACEDFYYCPFKMGSMENSDLARQDESLESSHRKRRGCIPCEMKWEKALQAWGDKNYFWGSLSSVKDQLSRWNGEDYYEVKRLTCQKCESFNLIGKEEESTISLVCKDCGFLQERK